MTRLIQTIFTGVVIASMTGCATPYMTDRGRDAMDIFTVSAGVGGGAKARVGPVHAGLAVIIDKVGLRGGKISLQERSIDAEILIPSVCPAATGSALAFGGEAYDPEGSPTMRQKTFCAISLAPFVTTELDPFSAAYFTQIEIAGGFGGTLRLGVNPGELLDFILGWTTIDIYKDDVESTRRKEQSSQNPNTADEPWE